MKRRNCIAILLAAMGASACQVRSRNLSAIGQTDLVNELTKAMKSTAGNGSAGGSRNGASVEALGSFTASEADARKTLVALYHTVEGIVADKKVGGGNSGRADDGTLSAAHWVYREGDVQGTIRVRLIQTGERQWSIIAFMHEA